MNLYLREVSLNDGTRELEYLRNLPVDENGFCNPAVSEDLVNDKSFKKWLIKKVNEAKGINLKQGYVPQTLYWVMLNDDIVGIGKLRHYLNGNLLVNGGHIGLGISSNHRHSGIGTKALKLLLDKACELGVEDVLLTNYEDNIASRRIVEKCGGVLEGINDGLCKYWIKVNKQL